MHTEELTAIKVRGWYDGVAYRLDKQGRKLSRDTKTLIKEDELCKPGIICKVEKIGECDYKILSSRIDV